MNNKTTLSLNLNCLTSQLFVYFAGIISLNLNEVSLQKIITTKKKLHFAKNHLHFLYHQVVKILLTNLTNKLYSHILCFVGGCNLKDFNLLSKLGDNITTVIDNGNNLELECNDSLINKKHGKWQQKGKQGVPLEVIGMDIGYEDDVSIWECKYVLS